MNRTNKIINIVGGLWGCLGFYRGHQYYKKTLKYDIEHNRKTQYYYITNFAFGLAGTTCYILCPFLIVPLFIYELYNLEETIRGIDTDD